MKMNSFNIRSNDRIRIKADKIGGTVPLSRQWPYLSTHFEQFYPQQKTPTVGLVDASGDFDGTCHFIEQINKNKIISLPIFDPVRPQSAHQSFRYNDLPWEMKERVLSFLFADTNTQNESVYFQPPPICLVRRHSKMDVLYLIIRTSACYRQLFVSSVFLKEALTVFAKVATTDIVVLSTLHSTTGFTPSRCMEGPPTNRIHNAKISLLVLARNLRLPDLIDSPSTPATSLILTRDKAEWAINHLPLFMQQIRKVHVAASQPLLWERYPVSSSKYTHGLRPESKAGREYCAHFLVHLTEKEINALRTKLVVPQRLDKTLLADKSCSMKHYRDVATRQWRWERQDVKPCFDMEVTICCIATKKDHPMFCINYERIIHDRDWFAIMLVFDVLTMKLKEVKHTDYYEGPNVRNGFIRT